MGLVRFLNKYIDTRAPWALAKVPQPRRDMTELWQDIRYGARLLIGFPGVQLESRRRRCGDGHRCRQDGYRVRYISAETFTNDLISSIRSQSQENFRNKYRSVDVLLIDDIQFLEGKIQTQEEFFHTFNTLHNANKQIVISSDRPPQQLVTLEDRLRNRFHWGLITDVQPPELETRIAILRKKAAQERLDAPPEVLDWIIEMTCKDRSYGARREG